MYRDNSYLIQAIDKYSIINVFVLRPKCKLSNIDGWFLHINC